MEMQNAKLKMQKEEMTGDGASLPPDAPLFAFIILHF